MQSPPEITHQVIVDEPDLDPLNDFKKVAQTLAKIIIKSDPQFTVGIYGEWGTGKTTLMRNICKEITDGSKDQKIIPVWFSAWRYGLEEHHATVALMKTIARQIDGSVDKFKFVRAALIYGSLNFVREVADNWVFKPITGSGLVNITKNVLNRTKLINVEQNTIYFDGLNKISEEMKKIREEDGCYRIVVFIDDLDRCSPQKALEVLESIKVFLDICGFVYVLGISYETTSELINYVYKELSIDGKDYIKKIIQVPISLPSWRMDKLHPLITELTEKHKLGIDAKLYEKILQIANYNPRQLKRIINSYIVAKKIYDNEQKLSMKDLFTILSFRNKMPTLVSVCMQYEELRCQLIGFFDALNSLNTPNDPDETIEMKVYELPLYNLDKLSNIDTLSDAFFFYLSRKNEPSKTPGDWAFGKSHEARRLLKPVLDSDELTQINWRKNEKFFTDFKLFHKLAKNDLYANVINMMEADLKIDKISQGK